MKCPVMVSKMPLACDKCVSLRTLVTWHSAGPLMQLETQRIYLLSTYSSPLTESILRLKNDSKSCLKQRRQRYHPRGMVCSTSLLSFSVLGLVSFIEWGGQICGEVAQPKSSHEKTGVRINPLAVRPLLAFIVFCAVISLGSDFASPPPSIYLHGFPSVLALDTLFPLSSSLFPHKCLDLRISMRCSTSYFLSLHQILARNSMLIHSSLPPCPTLYPTPRFCFTRNAQTLYLLPSWPRQ